MGSSALNGCVIMRTRESSGVMFLLFLATLCLLGATLAVDQEVQDFDFEDTANEVNLVKRSAALSDDEDLMLGDPTSTPLNSEDGSGTSESPVEKVTAVTQTATIKVPVAVLPVVVDYPRYYRVTIHYSSLRYSPALEERNSREFRELARELQRDLENLFRNLLGLHTITILQVSRGLLVTFDLGSVGEATEDEIRDTLLESVRRGRIGNQTVSGQGFTFSKISVPAHPCTTREFFCSANKVCINRTLACDRRKHCPDGADEQNCSEVSCPSHVGRNPDKLPRSGNNWANLLVNNVFPCDGNIVGWEYYRIIPQGSAYVGVWRQDLFDSHFNLISKTELPSAPVGIREVSTYPISVKKGDFIGIFYPRTTPNNVIAQAQLADDILSSNELYQNFHIEIFDDDITQNNNLINLENIDYNTINATFSLRAVMDYEVGPTIPVNGLTCKPNEFNCGDDCISQDLYCDGQIDCNNESDEKDCAPQPATCPRGLFLCDDGTCQRTCDCLEGRFRCNDGTCIERVLKCNGQVNCPDGSDEGEVCQETTERQCSDEEFQCYTGTPICIPRDEECNGIPECEDKSDELPDRCILPACPPDYVRCQDGTCRKETCDETEPMACTDEQFKCNGECFSLKMKCDGFKDCDDGSDEENCGEIFITGPEEAIVGTQVKLTCNITGRLERSNNIYWYKDDTINISSYSGNILNRIQIRHHVRREYHLSELYLRQAEISDSGSYTCATSQHVSRGFNLAVVLQVFTCEANQFKCKREERCIDERRRCDGRHDCRDKSDEMECSCRVDQFRCASGGCIDQGRRCNGQLDCSDRSDETGCKRCQDTDFTCTNGQCITFEQFCNGERDCEDGSDELCEFKCAENQFICNVEKKCINLDYTCDGNDDCLDGSDEQSCPGCKKNQFTCSDGSCVRNTSRCNRIRECRDYSDEFKCECDEVLEFSCANGQCVPASARCNNNGDCYDRSDEENCGCDAETELTCGDGSCVPLSARCDRRYDCSDRSDELECGCDPQTELTCGDGKCVPLSARCDRRYDCSDRSDESDCRCNEATEFTCDNGQCVPLRARCNRRFECSDQSDETNCDCDPLTQFKCADGQCVASSARCNRRFECSDRSDEENCGCSRTEFTCDDGSCVDRVYRCDRVSNCPDNSDEFNCTCNPREFRCANGQCIPSSARCDRKTDCVDRSDERNCPTCTSEQFTCDNGNCIDIRRKCDRRVDCRDGSDERDCPPRTCTSDQFTCENGDCIDIRRKCDGRDDCRDGSDERDCALKCFPGQFRCNVGGQCIDAGFRCDGQVDCSDSSDERNCPARCPGKFLCDVRRCIELSSVCDGRRNCNDNSDEKDCAPITCSSEQFTCTSGRCIDRERRCNRVNDCDDGSDESNCPCASGEISCDGTCFPRERRCDGERDCSDGSDEQNCQGGTSIYVSPQQMKKRFGTSASFMCNVVGEQPSRITWIRRTGTGGSMPPQAVITGNRLLIPDLRIEDAGDYLCQAFGSFGKIEAHARLEVEFVGPPVVPSDGPCGPDEVPCSNGACIYKGYYCDGDDDCRDGSDERNCPIDHLPCEPNEFRCDNGKCAMKIWRCDGDNDCGDRSDERNCEIEKPGSDCRASEFQCASRDQCIPLGYQCDGETDCLDRSDEVGCSKPTIITPPLPEITVEINGTFTIICEAIGVPTPLIVWRLNWGNIPNGTRVTVTSENGYGNLTIRNAIPQDAGAYTCEAVNNRGSIFAIPDANIIVRRRTGVCRDSTFNSEAYTENQCVKCFCFGQTQSCYSSSLQISQITMGSQVNLVRRQNLEAAEPGIVQYIPTSRQFEVKDFNSILRTGSWYWSLPHQFLKKQLNSYGGTLSYQVYYEVDGFENPTNDPDIILIGNGITLFHRADVYERVDRRFRPRQSTIVNIPLNESAWERSQVPSRGGPISQYATREDLMLVLENVTHILIRATYDSKQSLIRLGNVVLTTGRVEQTGLGRAIYVEECKCPAGYTGNSCEDCAPGFYRVVDGNNGRRCVACNCNQYSNECDPLTGICRNCRDNTAGPYCNECASGYYKDPRYGRCQSCPCPSSYGPIQFERSCFLDQDREVTCRCPPGYTGRRCERCARGYVGDPSIPGQFCYRQPDNVCDTRGSVSRLPNPLTGTCECKSSVTGTLCDTCKPETFYLSDANPMGCIPCFCMGVTQICQSSTWNRVPITLSFSQTSSDVTLTDVTQSEKIEEGFSIERQSRELVFTEFENYNNKILFWSLPQQFLGNKVTAYGGNLRFTLRYKAGRDNTPVSLVESLVTIRGSEIDLEYKVNAEVEEGRPVSFVVPMIENKWYKIDGNLVSRENFLMALANLQHIFIRATFTRDTAESAISAISLDVAEDRVTSRERAYQVEQCACPLGYKGLSCEDCDSGYTRTGGGLYLGLCEECRCNKHSTECDPENGVCKNCRHNTEGARCERCARGYYGDATRGTVNDCQKCPCPLTESPNQFSSDCVLDRDRQVTCTACPVGHEGRRCERCAPGYSGDPMSPGDYCKQISVKCECDDRGTMPNTECDPRTRQCQCKNNVEGRNCSTCRTGYFNLNKDLDMGCLKCFCMGITNICTSSYYYREEITPVLDADGSHNFALVNGRLSRTVTDGFSVNAARNEITFNNFEGSQREQDSLYFNLPPKFRGDKVSSYGGYLKFTLRYTASPTVGRDYTDLDVVLIGKQNQKLYHVFRPQLRPRQINRYEIHLVEDSFQDSDLLTPSRETFLTVLADISAILIRATYHHAMQSVTLGNLRMDIAGPNGRVAAPEVERCSCPEGYSGLSCQSCAPGFVRVPDPRTALGRCARCSCNGHSNSCDPATGVCQNCQHNTEGDRCERCIRGYYGDPTSGTPNDCRPCACPLTIPSNNFSPTCVLDTSDNRITCDKCPPGYTGRDCGQCAPEYSGNPRQPGGKCQRIQQFEVEVSPKIVREPLGSTIRFLCTPRGRGPFNVVWSRLDGQALPSRATIGTGPGYELTIFDVDYTDAGRYVCSVTNPDGSNRDTGTLIVERPDLPIKVRIQEPTRLVKRQGDQAEFICEAIQFNSAANYVLTWRKDGGQLPSKAVEQSGVLYIPDLDQNDLGRYTCTGSQRGSIDNATAEIMFGEIPESPTVRIEPPSIRVQEGQRVELVCVVTGSPRPTIKWTKGNTDTLPPHIITDREGRLIIESVSPSDRAAYYCIAENYVGTSRTRATILVLPATVARVIVRRADIIAIVGQSEQMVCETDGTGVTLQWSREGGLPPGARQSGGVLTLTNIQPSFAGTYLCTGTSITGTVIGRATSRLTVTGSINVKPTSRIEPAEGLTIGSGTTGTLRCIVTGEPAPTIVWTRSRGPLSSNHQVRGDVLRILQATPEDRDRYICTATNEAGVSVATVVVNIERREPPLVTLYPSVSLIKRQGESAMFQCRVTQGQPAPTVTWTRAGGLPLTERTKVEQNGVLMFRDLTQREQGEYICTSENVVGSVSATASLRVQGAPVIEITPGTTITVEEGRRLYIECVASGEPAPDVFWRSETRRRSDVLPDDVTENGRSRLAFDSVQKSDAGRYTCVARNELGETKETVEVIVNDASGSPETDLSIVGPSRLTYTVGQSIELTCLSKELPNAQITWRRPNRQPLPPGSRVSNGVLYIPRITPEYAGEYICSLANDFQTVFITVTVTSNLVISPSSTRVRAGASLRLSCQLGGSYPYTVEWSKEDGVLSPQARESNGVLDIRQVTSADAGRYKCVATTDIGSSEAYADVIVVVPPSIDIPTSIIPRYPYGSTIQLICNARGSPAPTVRWERENGAAFPDQHQIRDGVLTIYNASPVDSGSYSCIASNEAGREQITFPVIVDNDIGDEIGVNYFVEGDAIDLECTPESFTESATFKWSKLEGPISRYAVISNYSLHIENAKVSDSGTYRCTLTAPAGSRTVDIRLKVTAKPSINTFQEYTTAALGSPAQLKCNIQSSGPPRVTWIKKDGELPYEHEVSQDGSLYIPRVREGDTGAYACQGSGQVGPSVYPVYLFVGALVPYFGRNNENSYLEYLPLTDAYQDLDILLSFRPESTDGLLLYNGQYPTAAGDFVCFGLQQQVPEFRFDVGSGPAIIRGNRSLELNKWHTVHLKRSKKNGTLLVNDEPAYVGVAPGQHEGLDLGAPLYLGSVPDYRDIPPSTGYSRGFVGSLSQVQVKGVNMNLGAEAVSLKNVIPYDVCAIERPCVNGGTCRAFNIRYGYVCECPSGFGGEKCEQRRETCSPGLCGPEGRCVNLPQGGYSCACPLRLTGDRCSRTIQIADPAFDRTSFISYDTIKGGLMTLSIKLDFNPRRLEDGIILYNAQKADGKQDFIALVVKDRHLEFRFDVGSGPAIIRSRYPLRANEWTKVVAERRGREGMLTVNDEESVNAQVAANDRQLYDRLDRGDVIRGSASGNKSVGLNLERPLYLGGVDPSEVINPGAGVYTGFIGCVGQLVVNERNIGLIDEARETMNIRDCGERTMCSRKPCQNNGVCTNRSPTEYFCTCPEGFSGRNCEVKIDICVLESPCNEGICVPQNNYYRCMCPLNWAGNNCQYSVKIGTSANFQGEGYIEISSDKFPRQNRRAQENLTVTITTTEPNGLIIWQGQKPDSHIKATSDYFAVAVVDGYLEFSYDLGDKPGVLRSLLPVNDGYPHDITVSRNGKHGKLKVDQQAEVSGLSGGGLKILNVMGNIFVGGVPDMKRYTDNTFSKNFNGCVSNLRLFGSNNLDFGVDALGGLNVVSCETRPF